MYDDVPVNSDRRHVIFLLGIAIATGVNEHLSACSSPFSCILSWVKHVVTIGAKPDWHDGSALSVNRYVEL